MNKQHTIRVLFDEDVIARRNRELAHDIAQHSFEADLIRALHREGLSPDVEFIQLSSYRKAQISSGQVTIVKDVDSAVKDRDILLVDDILESGRTIAYAKDLLSARGARRVWVCVLLEKPGKRAVVIDADFVGFPCPDLFVVGYGMDVAHAYRELPYVGIVES
jgi:hypoxanthine phosphoribosyltransferase